MRKALPITTLRSLRTLRPLLAAALTAALCMGVTGCGTGLLGGDSDDLYTQNSTGALSKPVKMNPRTVRSFYARASEAYRTRDAAVLCEMTQRSYAKAIVKQAKAQGLQISSCEELWQTVFVTNPDGYADPLTDLKVKGKAATFLSGGDPWRVQMIRSEMKIVAPGGN